ncbi:hypothetical protein Y032_0438g1476 [Ancylostoma ceylanicum]|uniref:ShKT domain-containing protein n=1 Tax=Ancylostoma ceylanicum TaxID=53326 RepID=A0A016X0U1_9BILA|nr:hypothetical protein Y032_0438g1476 [Ancylostoma ceylanicum]
MISFPLLMLLVSYSELEPTSISMTSDHRKPIRLTVCRNVDEHCEYSSERYCRSSDIVRDRRSNCLH